MGLRRRQARLEEDDRSEGQVAVGPEGFQPVARENEVCQEEEGGQRGAAVRSWWCDLVLSLRAPRRRLAGAEGVSRVSQVALNFGCEWMRTTQHSPRGWFRLRERRHGLAEIVERRAVVHVVVMLASFVAVSRVTPNTSRRVVGQWGGTGGAICEDHLALAGSEGRGVNYLVTL